MGVPGGEAGGTGGSPEEPAGCLGEARGGSGGTPGDGPAIPVPAAGAPGIRRAAGASSGVRFPRKSVKFDGGYAKNRYP